jgi:orotate phosphoribosyltransferase
MDLNIFELVWEIYSKEKSALRDESLFEFAKSYLLRQIKEKSLFRGEFILSSGKKSDYYLDLRRLTLDSEASPIIGYLILYKIYQLDKNVDGVAGPTLGADPIISAVLTAAPFFNLNLRGLIVRKEEKKHGLGKMIEGPQDRVSRVFCVEDVVTTGGSLLRAVKVLKEADISVRHAIVIVDRSEGDVSSVFAAEDVKLHSLFKVREVLE